MIPGSQTVSDPVSETVCETVSDPVCETVCDTGVVGRGFSRAIRRP